ncbi:MAG: outer membrane protein assembly factor BamE [Rhodospirillales bacterium]|nr:outer membrane protein assembly factor BamE [Rhodospirillales bacterium]
MRDPLITRSFIAAAVLAGAVGLASCAPRVAQRGVMPDIDAIAAIQPNKTTKDEVERSLGSPSSINMYGKETWLYVGEVTETVAFLERDVSERSVLLVTFDKDGVVTDVEAHGLDVARDIEPVERKTPTVGKQMTVIEQLVGNFNRFKNIGSSN